MESKLGTIAAIATSLHNSSIGIIRVSGEEAVSIVDRIFVNKRYLHILKDMKSHTIHYGYIIENGHEIIDEVMVSAFDPLAGCGGRRQTGAQPDVCRQRGQSGIHL